MRSAKEFLEQECCNLEAVLEETLRFKYGVSGSKDFFEECSVRLKFISAELSAVQVNDHSGLQKVACLLLELSGLISRIERSSIGEYSWPFVEELKLIASAICTEATLTNPNAPPKIHVLSDGGLDKYAIYTEKNRPSSAGQRILTIVFPRSLKHFVLLHPILGHEIGHAMWGCSVHQSALKVAINTHLLPGSQLATPASTAAWLYSATAPAEARAFLTKLAAHGINQNNFFDWASWPAWIEEILCDFIGLLSFGPSFVSAECNLLQSLDPSGTGIGQSHPPVACRANYLIAASHLRGYDFDAFADAQLRVLVKAYWDDLNLRRLPNPWFDVFTDAQIQATCNAMDAILRPLTPALYTNPSETDLAHLLKQLERTIPPTGFEMKLDRSMTCRKVDFRHTLYAGWVATIALPGSTFKSVNRLCEHGIMQQRAIDIELSP